MDTIKVSVLHRLKIILPHFTTRNYSYSVDTMGKRIIATFAFLTLKLCNG